MNFYQPGVCQQNDCEWDFAVIFIFCWHSHFQPFLLTYSGLIKVYNILSSLFN